MFDEIVTELKKEQVILHDEQIPPPKKEYSLRNDAPVSFQDVKHEQLTFSTARLSVMDKLADAKETTKNAVADGNEKTKKPTRQDI